MGWQHLSKEPTRLWCYPIWLLRNPTKMLGRYPDFWKQARDLYEDDIMIIIPSGWGIGNDWEKNLVTDIGNWKYIRLPYSEHNDTKELVDDIEKIKIKLNGMDCYSVSAHFLKYTYPNRYLNISKIPKGYYYYSFCKNPFNASRGSTLNASRFDTFIIEFIFNKNTNHNIKIITTNLNLLRTAGGMAGQAYSP